MKQEGISRECHSINSITLSKIVHIYCSEQRPSDTPSNVRRFVDNAILCLMTSEFVKISSTIQIKPSVQKIFPLAKVISNQTDNVTGKRIAHYKTRAAKNFTSLFAKDK